MSIERSDPMRQRGSLEAEQEEVFASAATELAQATQARDASISKEEAESHAKVTLARRWEKAKVEYENAVRSLSIPQRQSYESSGDFEVKLDFVQSGNAMRLRELWPRLENFFATGNLNTIRAVENATTMSRETAKRLVLLLNKIQER